MKTLKNNEKEFIAKLYLSGKTQSEISEFLGISKSAVQKARRETGIPPQKPSASKSNEQRSKAKEKIEVTPIAEKKPTIGINGNGFKIEFESLTAMAAIQEIKEILNLF